MWHGDVIHAIAALKCREPGQSASFTLPIGGDVEMGSNRTGDYDVIECEEGFVTTASVASGWLTDSIQLTCVLSD